MTPPNLQKELWLMGFENETDYIMSDYFQNAITIESFNKALRKLQNENPNPLSITIQK